MLPFEFASASKPYYLHLNTWVVAKMEGSQTRSQVLLLPVNIVCVDVKTRCLCIYLALFTTWEQSFIRRYYHVVLRESRTGLVCNVLEIKLLLSPCEQNCSFSSSKNTRDTEKV